MKNNYYENPQNGGNGEQPMQNPAQTNGTNGQAYLEQPYGSVPTPQNYNQLIEQNNFNNYAGQQTFGNYETTGQTYCTPPYAQNSMYEQYSDNGYQSVSRFENDELGKITNRDRAMQTMDFTGMVYGQRKNCTPMNIDMVLDVKTKGYVFGEIKYFPDEVNEQIYNGIIKPEEKIKLGEKITLMGITDTIQDGGKAACVLLIDSETANPHEDVDVSKAIVLSVYFNHRWRICRYRNIVRFHTDLFWNAVLTRRDWGNWLDWYYDNWI